MRKTKIVCTIGPASSSYETLKAMLLAGMNVARFNMSHGTHESHAKSIADFRKVRDELGLPASILIDTKGPEIRIGLIENGAVIFDEGDVVRFTTKRCIGNKKRIYVDYKNLPNIVSPGDNFLIDDGKVRMQVTKIEKGEIEAKVTVGGRVSTKKGINIPNVHLDMPYLSKKDLSDLAFAAKNNADYIAASFVRCAQDVIDLRKVLADNGAEMTCVISKIENQEGIDNFEEILEVSDGIMVARGDMGVEIDYERLPGIQKYIIRRCQQSGKIAITATQMLDSMIHSPVPTRAEITDVANAVFDGTSAVMLSGESASGDYPVESTAALAKIAAQAEIDGFKLASGRGVYRDMDAADVTNAVGHAACTLAKDIRAKALIAITKTGYTAKKMSKFRPMTTIIGATPHNRTYHQLALEWGVEPIKIFNSKDRDKVIAACIEEAKKRGLVEPGDKVVCSAGVPMEISGNTNMIQVETVK